jgi:hypothetical protein
MIDEIVLDREKNHVENFLSHGLAYGGLGVYIVKNLKFDFYVFDFR